MRTIVVRSGGTIGEILAFVRAAAVAMIESGEEAITGRALDQAACRGLGERRAQLDRDGPRSIA